MNSHRIYLQMHPRIIQEGEWTRWFNLHSRRHMDATYPRSVRWHQSHDGSKPLYTQLANPDLPGSIPFPAQSIQAHWPEAAHYFLSTICWLLAFALHEGFDRIELWGFQRIDEGHREDCTPCFWYWIDKAHTFGIDVIYQPEVERYRLPPGNPAHYRGPLYGYATS